MNFLPARNVAVFLFAGMHVMIALADEDGGTESGNARVKFAPFQLDTVLSIPEIWSTSIDAVVESHQDGDFQLEWTSEAHDSARASRPELFYLERPAQELLLEAEDGIVTNATVIFFARGNMWETIDKPAFDKAVRTLAATLDTRTGKSSVQPKRDAASAARAYVLEWSGTNAVYELAYSYEKTAYYFKPEFIRLRIRPPETGKKPLLQVKPGMTVSRGLERTKRADVRKDANGDVWLEDVPMVDQGERGYCVVASIERVLKYYGVETDQHELAQVADASAMYGTSVAEMDEALKRLSTRLRIRPIRIVDFEFNDFKRLITNYNREARAKKLPATAVEDGLGAYERFDRDALRAARGRETAAIAKFSSGISAAIAKREPLLWCVRLGVVPEPEIPQAFGGHMRLIIGMNEKTSEIIYTDSWGAGHEFKRMDLGDAWAITTNLSVIAPMTQ